LDRGLFAGRDLELVHCTQKTVLDAHLATLDSAELLVVSVLENIVVKVCTGVSDEEVQLFARQQITALVEGLHSVVQRIPDVAIVITPPMYRSTPAWFGPYLPDFISFLSSEVSRIGSPKMTVCSPFIVTPSMLDADGVHLTALAGDRFLSHLDAQLGFLLVEVEPLPVQPPVDKIDQILALVSQNSLQLNSFQGISETVSDLARSASSFESFVLASKMMISSSPR